MIGDVEGQQSSDGEKVSMQPVPRQAWSAPVLECLSVKSTQTAFVNGGEDAPNDYS